MTIAMAHTTAARNSHFSRTTGRGGMALLLHAALPFNTSNIQLKL